MPLAVLAAAPLAVLALTAVALAGWTALGPPPARLGQLDRFPTGGLGAAAALGLALAAAAAAWQLGALAGGGSLVLQLWSLAPHLPLTIRADPTGATLVLVALACAGLSGLGERTGDRWTATFTVAAAAAGALAALAGDLVTLWTGLVLVSLAGFGLAWRAEGPRLPLRVWLGAGITFAVDLAFLAAVLTVARQAGTTDYAVIPPGSVGPPLLALLLAPGAVRLTGSWTVRMDEHGGRRRPRTGVGGGWFAVATVPAGIAALVRVVQLAGPTWPPQPIAGGLIALGVVSALAGGATAVWPRPTVGRGVRGVLLAEAGLALVALALGGPDGLVLGIAAALVVAVTAVVLPALPGWARAAQGGGVVPVALLVAGSSLPPTLGFGIGVLVAADASSAPGLAEAAVLLAWVAGLPAMAATAFAIRRAVGAPPGPAGRPLAANPGGALAALVLLAAAIVPAAVFRFVVPALVGSGAAGSRLAGTSRWLSDGLAGVSWPGGELAVVAGLGLALWWAVGVLGRGSVRVARSPVPRPPKGPRAAEGLATEAAMWRLGARLTRWAAVGLEAASVGSALVTRSVRDQPEWLWLATVSALAWLVLVR